MCNYKPSNVSFCIKYNVGKHVTERRFTIQTMKKQAGNYARAVTLHGIGYIEGIYEMIYSLSALFLSNIFKPYL